MSATLLLSVGDIMGSDSPEQSTSTHPYPGDGGERKFSLSRTLFSVNWSLNHLPWIARVHVFS